MQELLRINGYSLGQDKAGTFGKGTEAAVARFQKNHGILIEGVGASGRVDMPTLERLTGPKADIVPGDRPATSSDNFSKYQRGGRLYQTPARLLNPQQAELAQVAALHQEVNQEMKDLANAARLQLLAATTKQQRVSTPPRDRIRGE